MSDCAILAIIPARGGSKGIPGKNIKELAGKPLIAYTIEAARRAPSVSRVVVSTDRQSGNCRYCHEIWSRCSFSAAGRTGIGYG